MEHIITTKNLNLWYGASHALKSINMEIPEKKITALIGTLWLWKIHLSENIEPDE